MGCVWFCGGFEGREKGLVWRKGGGFAEERASCVFVREWMRFDGLAGFV